MARADDGDERKSSRLRAYMSVRSPRMPRAKEQDDGSRASDDQVPARAVDGLGVADAAALAIALVKQVVAGQGSLAVVRKPSGGVAIRPGEVPGLDVGVGATLVSRHRRFRTALDEAMAEAGFTRMRPYRFKRER